MDNNLLDSSSLLEAFALNYASFGVLTVVNSLWTWLAIVTAAVSFWRIRTASFSEKPDHQQPLFEDRPLSDHNNNSSVEIPAPSPSPSPSPAPIAAIPSIGDVKGVDCVTEGAKYTLYYYYDEEERESDGDGEATAVKEWGGDIDDASHGVSCSGEGWEKRVTMRVVDLGWYRYQDLTVINGNVVRLWDDQFIIRRRR